LLSGVLSALASNLTAWSERCTVLMRLCGWRVQPWRDGGGASDDGGRGRDGVVGTRGGSCGFRRSLDQKPLMLHCD